MEREYGWKRFWHRLGDETKLSLWDDGFLEDPERPSLEGGPSSLKTLDKLCEQPCLVLLGEPGMGKSRAMHRIVEELSDRPTRGQDQIFEVDLKGASDEQEVRRRLFENEIFREWRSGVHQLHWFIDSLDECLLRLDRLALLLAEEFQKRIGCGELKCEVFDDIVRQNPALGGLPPRVVEKTHDAVRIHWTRLRREELERIDAQAKQALAEKLPAARLHLRMACRTADWQDSFHALEITLAQLGWSEDAPVVYALAPLRRTDVSHASLQRGIDSEAFLREVVRVNAVPLASKPVTLEFLFGQFKDGGTRLPGTQAELYERGCRRLCQEEEKERSRERRREFDAARRFAVAARIAAVTVFSGKSSIRTASEQGVSDSLMREELVGQRESVDGNEFEVVDAAIGETLATALFSAGGEFRLRWAHQTYAEFLAAWYLAKQRRLDPKRILELLFHPHDPEQRVVPQLREVAAWLAALDTRVCRRLLEQDPLILLRSDISTADEDTRRKLVDSLLRLHDDKKGPVHSFGSWRDYQQLDHPGLVEQLRPYLRERTHDDSARYLALDIIEAVGGRRLRSDLLELALSQDESYWLRVRAAQILVDTKDITVLQAMKPLLRDEAHRDPEDRLKCIVLKALWTERLISAKEFFDSLTEPKRYDTIGSYHAFIGKGVYLAQLDADGVTQALSWLSGDGRWAWERGILLEASKLRPLLEQACHYAGHPGTVEAASAFVMSWLRYGLRSAAVEPVLGVLSIDAVFRRLVLECLLVRFFSSEQDVRRLIRVGYETFVHRQDLPWMLQKLREQPSETSQAMWAELIRLVHDWYESEFRDDVIDACGQFSSLARALHMEPVKLGSEKARRLREELRELGELEREARKSSQEDKPPLSMGQRIAVVLEGGGHGEFDKWELIVWELSHRCAWADARDIRELSGWKELDDAIRARILPCARSFILEHGPNAERWLGTNIVHLSAVAGNMALLYLQANDSSLAWIPADAWQRWAPAVLERACGASAESEEGTQQLELVRLARKHAPHEVLRVIQCVLDYECREGTSLSIVQAIEPIWDDEFAQILYGKLTSERKLSRRCVEALLAPLIERQYPAACVLAEAWLRPGFPVSNDEVVAAAKVLLKEGKRAETWNIVWALFQRSPEIGAEVISDLGHFDVRDEDWLIERLSAEQIAELYIWLWRNFPMVDEEEGSSESQRGRFLKAVDEVDWWRRSILRYLKRLGTLEAVRAIAHIRQELPRVDGLRQAEWEAQELANRNTWEPLHPRVFLEFVNIDGTRIVQSPERLLDVVLESLERLQQKLRGETPAAIHLWSEGYQKRLKLRWPKNEEAISDFVVLHLEQDLRERNLLIAREVRIRRGERTDIHVVTSISERQGRGAQIGLIIEVKGSWNPEVDTALQEQLVERYLRDNPGRAGLYLVAWFPREQWDSKDSRRKKSKRDIKDVRRRIEEQVQALSSPGCRVAAFVLDASLR